MLQQLYAAATTAAAPALRLLLHRRVARGKELAARLGERRGRDSAVRAPGPLLWLHCASVGETVSILGVVAALAAREPCAHVLLTTGTVTSTNLLAERLPALGLTARVTHRFAPLDVPRWAARFLDHWRPDVAVFVESEVWPNLLAGCRARGIPTVLLNARVSARSLSRWKLVPGFARMQFGGFSRVLAQSEADAERLRTLGATDVSADGNLKFAAPPLPVAAGELERLRGVVAGRPVWLAASTHPGEEAIVGAVHASLLTRYPGLLTIVAPRHPARGAEIADALAPTPVMRRSVGQDPPAAAGIWVADTMGELGLLYSLAGIAFVGGSLVPHGGQNPLEPARLGCAVAMGPHASNFAEPVAVLAAAGAIARVADGTELTRWVDAMLDDPAARARMGTAGRAAACRSSDLPDRIAAVLATLLAARTAAGVERV